MPRNRKWVVSFKTNVLLKKAYIFTLYYTKLKYSCQFQCRALSQYIQGTQAKDITKADLTPHFRLRSAAEFEILFCIPDIPLIATAPRGGICMQTVQTVDTVRPLTSRLLSSPPLGRSAPWSSGTT